MSDKWQSGVKAAHFLEGPDLRKSKGSDDPKEKHTVSFNILKRSYKIYSYYKRNYENILL